jgi:hypothetical protein
VHYPSHLYIYVCTVHSSEAVFTPTPSSVKSLCIFQSKGQLENIFSIAQAFVLFLWPLSPTSSIVAYVYDLSFHPEYNFLEDKGHAQFSLFSKLLRKVNGYN